MGDRLNPGSQTQKSWNGGSRAGRRESNKHDATRRPVRAGQYDVEPSTATKGSAAPLDAPSGLD